MDSRSLSFLGNARVKSASDKKFVICVSGFKAYRVQRLCPEPYIQAVRRVARASLGFKPPHTPRPFQARFADYLKGTNGRIVIRVFVVIDFLFMKVMITIWLLLQKRLHLADPYQPADAHSSPGPTERGGAHGQQPQTCADPEPQLSLGIMGFRFAFSGFRV